MALGYNHSFLSGWALARASLREKYFHPFNFSLAINTFTVYTIVLN
jgi:hypothetical protein